MNPKTASEIHTQFSRRQVLTMGLAATTSTFLGMNNSAAADKPEPENAPPRFERKIKLGVVGNGGRGGWIAGLFKKHGGYEMYAVADYFQEVADKCGNALGVDRSRRFSTLSGYKRLFECGVEAVALETPPYFFPEHTRAAVEAGLHVYMAKPVATDVPGCMRILETAKLATQKKRVFLVDYQMPTEPINIEIVKAIHDGELGKVSQIYSYGVTQGFPDPIKTGNYESRLQKLIWCNDAAMGGDYIGNYDIHAIDAALWVIGQRPIAAMGASSICRPDPHGDSRDVCSLVYEYADGLVHNHFGQALRNNSEGGLSVQVHGQTANALINYWGKAYVRGGSKPHAGAVQNLYQAGAERNIARFYREVTENRIDNNTVPRAVDGALACFLGRDAAARRTRLTMSELLKENRHLEIDLSGLKA